VNDTITAYAAPHEILDLIVDEWTIAEKAAREAKGIPTSKLQLKTELGRAMGLGNGSDSDDAALKGVYRYCSGETPLSLEKAIIVSSYIKDDRLAQWFAFRLGLVATPRAALDEADLSGDDVFLSLIESQQKTSSLLSLLSSAYQKKPSRRIMGEIEATHQQALEALEKSRLLMLRAMEAMLKSSGGSPKGRPGAR
jgi:hypothetical protein